MYKKSDIPGVNTLEDIRRRYALEDNGAKFAEKSELVTLKVNGDDDLINKAIRVSSGSIKYAVIMGADKKAVFTGLPVGTYSVTAEGLTSSETVNIPYFGVYEVTLTSVKTYGVSINLADSNPLSCVTYTDAAVGMTPGSSDFDSFFGYRPCLFKDGAVVSYLNPNDYTKDTDGNAVDITSGGSGNVMVEFPRRDISISKSGSVVSVKITNEIGKSGFTHNAHRRGSVDKADFYVSAYYGYVSGGKLWSLSGIAPTLNQVLATYRSYAQANGTGYDILAWYQLLYLQVLYLIKYKNLNSQSAVGMGRVNGSAATTGNTNTRGMCWGSSDTSYQVKLFGIEDLWGNYRCWIDGLYRGGTTIFGSTDNFNNNGSGYSNIGTWTAGDSWQSFFNNCYGTNDMGFLAASYGGSATTYFCDICMLMSSYGSSAMTANDYNNSTNAGIFNLVLSASATVAVAIGGARLMYL